MFDIPPRKGAEAYKTFKETIERVHAHLAKTVAEAACQMTSRDINSPKRG